MRLSDTIRPAEGFQTSVNIELDLGNMVRVAALVPTAQVRKQVEGLLRDVISPSTHRAKLLVGAYGRGKSHLVLAALTAMWDKGTDALNGLKESYRKVGSPFCDVFDLFVEQGARLFPIIVSGGSSDLRRSLLKGIKTSLRRFDLEDLMPTTNYAAAAAAVKRWADEYPETLNKFEHLVGMKASEFEARMAGFDTDVYTSFLAAYPKLTSGGEFDPVDGSDIFDVVDCVLAGLEKRGIAGAYIVYDEFGKYLEANIGHAGMEDVRLLQDLAERCNRSGQTRQLHLLLICHKSISNYIESGLPKDRADGWRGVSGRFLEIELPGDDDQAYELMAAAVVKDEAAVDAWLSEGDRAVLRNKAVDDAIRNGLASSETRDVLASGCFPLHPVTAFLLPRISSRVAQNERTLFTFLCADEDRALLRILDACPGLVSPDVVYDYFEQLLRKEYHGTAAHRAYELVKQAIEKGEPNELEERLIKTLGLIEASGQQSVVPPKPDTLLGIYATCGWSQDEVAAALERLTRGDGPLYLRRSDGLLRLKEFTGIDVGAEASDKAAAIAAKTPLESILNGRMAGRALYPSKYNEDHEMVRYFDFEFTSVRALSEKTGLPARTGDGAFIAIVPSSPDEIALAIDAAEAYTATDHLCMVAVPVRWSDVTDAAYMYAAAVQLRGAADSEALADEYDLILEDCRESVDSYIGQYLHPEFGGARYFANGEELGGISRRSQLSHQLSRLCEEAFPYAPRITSEALNRNELTGAALHSRAKLIRALLRPTLEPNLGFFGNSQELTMARNALYNTSIIADIEHPDVTLEPGDENVKRVLQTIVEFLTNASGEPLSNLYDMLCSDRLGIGMKRGPVAVFLAVVLRQIGDSVAIKHGDAEREATVELIDDISANPAAYTVTAFDWDSDIASYVTGILDVFGATDIKTRTRAVDALRTWYVSLPQVTRNAIDVPGRTDDGEKQRRHRDLMACLRKAEVDINEMLFWQIPSALGVDRPGPEAVTALRDAKDYAEQTVADVLAWIVGTTKRALDPMAPAEASLGSVAAEWVESLAKSTLQHAFTGRAAALLKTMADAGHNDAATAMALAKAMSSLRPGDWSSRTFEDYVRNLESAITEVVDYQDPGLLSDSGTVSISFSSGEGAEVVRSFSEVECSPRARLLRNDILACLDEVGRSLSPEERRQVVFEVLKGLC